MKFATQISPLLNLICYQNLKLNLLPKQSLAQSMKLSFTQSCFLYFQYGESTVYVHGFGTTNDADENYNDYNDYHNEVTPHVTHPVVYEKPAYAQYTPAPYQAPYHGPAVEPYQAHAPAPYQPPIYQPKPYGAPTYYEKPGYTRGYGYGHIDGYGNARHGYGFAKQYGYEAPVYAEHASAPAAYQPGPLGVPPTPPVYGGHLKEEVPHTPSLGHGFGYGFSHFQ